MENKIEDDIKAIKIYLSLGYTHKEALHRAFKNIFPKKTKQNLKRWAKIKKFIDKFENETKSH